MYGFLIADSKSPTGLFDARPIFYGTSTGVQVISGVFLTVMLWRMKTEYGQVLARSPDDARRLNQLFWRAVLTEVFAVGSNSAVLTGMREVYLGAGLPRQIFLS